MIRRMIVAIVILLGLIAMVTAILTYKMPAPAPAPSADNTVAPSAPPGDRFVVLPGADFSTVAPLDGNGQPADMSPFRGKALLVNLWATWCAPCIQELPALGKLQQELGGDVFQVVTIAFQERDPAKIAPFLAAHGAANLPALVDPSGTIDKVAQVTALPTSLLVGPDGKVKAMLTGDAHWTCGTALAAVKAFIADGTISPAALEECEN